MKPRSKKLSRRRLTKRAFACAAIVIGALALAAASKPGRTTLRKVMASIGVQNRPLDIEEKVRATEGWSTEIHNSVLSGTITYFDRSGAVTGGGAITLRYKYPDKVRVEITRQDGFVQVTGLGSSKAWSSSKSSLTPAEARDIRGWLRIRPERLFTERDAGASYREAGAIYQDHIPPMPWQPAQNLTSNIPLDQVAIVDSINGAASPAGAGSGSAQVSAVQNSSGDQRLCYYYINRNTGLVWSERWLEPDDPARDPNSPGGSPSAAIEVDFRDYHKVNGTMMPFEIVHWWGGKVDYRIVFDRVQINQPAPDASFERP